MKTGIGGRIKSESVDDFSGIRTPKHKALKRISVTANVFAWIVLVFLVLQAFSQYLNITSQQSFQSIIEIFKKYPESAINLFLNIINILLKGVVYWLTLKGVSLGLNMIVETDLNYRERLQGENHE
jgi:hypothetical protein